MNTMLSIIKCTCNNQNLPKLVIYLFKDYLFCQKVEFFVTWATLLKIKIVLDIIWKF